MACGAVLNASLGATWTLSSRGTLACPNSVLVRKVAEALPASMASGAEAECARSDAPLALYEDAFWVAVKGRDLTAGGRLSLWRARCWPSAQTWAQLAVFVFQVARAFEGAQSGVSA